ncbi:disease resistance-like protein DSC1 [Cannabis sativa]|uniref:disease resistance-like protein DSC1 n=1 Tax=Cannabis sativa TaxID=3483 RepID=UPI0029CA48FC|nr:disease resistance-like protein DSC1 [Cannabis sativa]
MLKELEAYESSFDDCVLNLKDCYNLRTISEMFGDIKFIYLQGTKIEELHPSIGYLKNLLVLDLSDCENLKNLPSSICYSESLELLVMHGCQSIDKFPKLPLNIKRLDLSGTSIRQINSSSFECMPYLKSLDMSCSKLESLPTTVCKLKSLEVLALAHCSQLKSFPEILEPMENLKKILLHCTSIDVVPPSIEHLVNLERLDLSECKNLKSLPMSNIYEMCNISTIFIDENPTQQDLVVLLSLDEYISVALQQSECRGFCSNTNLISILKLNFEHQVYSFWKDITCCECLLFNTILILLMCKTQQDEIFKIKPEWGSEVADRGKALYGPRMGFSYPRNKIPDWCTHTSMGASTHVDSLITWSGRRNFLGIVICIVVNFDDGCIFNDNEWSIYCKMYGLIIEDEPYYIDSSLLKIQKYSDYDTHHVFICYLIKRDIHDRFYHALSASFIFEFAEENQQYGSCESSRIEQCGIRMVYNEDVEELEEDQLMLDAETHNNVEEN